MTADSTVWTVVVVDRGPPGPGPCSATPPGPVPWRAPAAGDLELLFTRLAVAVGGIVERSENVHSDLSRNNFLIRNLEFSN